MSFSETVNKVIDLAGKVRDYYDIEVRKRHPNYPLVGPGEEEAPPPPVEKELSDFLGTLSEEMIYRLILIVFLARGAVGTDNLAEYYDTLKDTVGNAQQAAEWLMIFKATLADELSDGLEELRQRSINVDKMPLKKVKVRKR